MTKRTDIDFSKMEYHKTITDDVKIYELTFPNSGYHRCTFINARGTMMVNGEWGNWVFCREFHPAKGESVSDSYWNEKLQIASEQKATAYDAEKTLEAINEILDELSENWENSVSYRDEVEYWQELREYVDYEHEYLAEAYNSMPSDMCSESIPVRRTTHFWLKVVYDAFDEICRRESEL